MTPSFWQVARQPKWIAAFFGVLAVAAVFAGLAQWQLERTFVTVGTLDPNQPAVPVDQLMLPGQPILSANLDREVSAVVKPDLSRSWLVSNRQQLTATGELERGYWLVSLLRVEHPNFGPTDLAVAVGYTADLAQAQAALAEVRAAGSTGDAADEPIELIEIRGYLEPNEAPVTETRFDEVSIDIVKSVSIGQLVNLPDADAGGEASGPIASYPGFLILIDGIAPPAQLQPIEIAIQSATIEVNWLTAFYAIEWAIFGGFAFYVWWRLVTDARLRSVTKS